MDRANKNVSRDVAHLVGFVLSYDVERKMYRVRLAVTGAPIVACPALDVGTDSPFSVGDRVIVHHYHDYGYVLLGRLPAIVSQRPLTAQQPDDTKPDDLTDGVSCRDVLDKESALYAEAGDISVLRGSARLFISKAGVMVHKVADTCIRYMSRTLSTIKDICYTYILSQPGVTVVSKVDMDQTSPSVGQPQVAVEVAPTDTANTMTLKLGGGVTDAGTTDGMALVMGQLVRLLLKLTAANPTLEYTHGEGRTRVSIDLQQFLLQFGQARFTWDDTGLTITQGASKLQLSVADVLEIVTSGLTLLMSGSVGLTAKELNVAAPAVFTTPVKIQGFDALTVYTTLNSLILAFNAHIHQVGPVPTSPPAGAGAVLPVTPTP